MLEKTCYSWFKTLLFHSNRLTEIVRMIMGDWASHRCSKHDFTEFLVFCHDG